MGGEKVDEQFEVMEWKIKNFCFWNKDIHGTNLKEYCCLDLFPRGMKGDGERLVLQVHDTHATSVDVSFIGSDGSLLCKQQINNPKWENGIEELPSGPKFEEVVRAWKKNPECKDTLIILCRLKKEKSSWSRLKTNLVGLDICLRVPDRVFNDIKFGQPEQVCSISYPDEYDGDNVMNLLVTSTDSVTDESKVVFTLQAGYASEKVLIHTNISLRDTDDSIIKYQENDHLFCDYEEWMFSDVLQKKEVIGKGFSLIIYLIAVTGDIKEKKIYSIFFEQCAEIITLSSENARASKSRMLKDSITLLSKELMSLYQDQDHADFHLHCESATFATHKGILSARSPVFKSMLSSGMKEAASNSMEITDIDVYTLGRFLTFLYSGTVEDLQWESALKLYYTADKYEVPSLKNECKAVLTTSVSTSNVCRILSLASKHQDDDLLSVTHEFLLENNYEVLKSEEWVSFMLEEPYLASQTATHILLKKST